MKRFYILFTTLFVFSGVRAQIINFPDAVFKAKLLATSASSNVAQNLSNANFKIDANSNGEIEVSEAQQVSALYMIGSPVSITSFEGILNFTNLKRFNSTMNNAPILNLSGLPLLNYLDCQATHVVNLNISNCPSLNYVNASLNEMTAFNMAGDNNLVTLNLYGCDLSTLDVSNFGSLEDINLKQSDQLANLNVSGCTHLKKLNCAQTLITALDVSGLSFLETLDASSGVLISINLLGCTGLKTLICNQNQLATLNLDGLSNLLTVQAGGNNLTSMSFSGCPALKELILDSNLFTTFNPTNLPSLEKLVLSSCELTSLYIAGMPQLKTLDVYMNQLTAIDFSGLTGLTSAQLSINNFTALDFSGCPLLAGVTCGMVPSLTTINAKNGSNLAPYFVGNMTSLVYICANENNIAQIQTTINAAGLSATCHVNSYCSFTPGGAYYTIRGNTKFDALGDGCDATDIIFPNIKLAFTNGTVSGNYVGDHSGSYQYDVQAGTHTLTPVLENPNYYTISPLSVSVTFPSTASPLLQDFCVTPNGSHPDLEITILPLSVARPGFDAQYLLTYKNKGNQMLSGTVNFLFNDAVLDVVQTLPGFTAQSANQLSWDFSNLNIGESRSIRITLNLNSPMETPPLIGQDVLVYEVVVASPGLDETPEDNSAHLHQTVLNSFDPNDKTCLEGTTIAPEMVGKEVHYMIRFENTGTFAAENIVVKDMIDTAKFDITSLIPIDGSHPFVTKISNTNKVEFIFENINLPFGDANNDGYVAFKIKTKPTLVVGNSFSNTASIYFDYNFPIVTNTATTTVALLANVDFVFEDYFKIYPNPANDVLNIESKKTIEVTSINIYNTLGQIVLVIPNAQQTKLVDVSSLKSGNYFVKINSDKGSSSVKFVKL
jgi:hypothetical protein